MAQTKPRKKAAAAKSATAPNNRARGRTRSTQHDDAHRAGNGTSASVERGTEKAVNRSGSVKLAKGELKDMVFELMRKRPTAELTSGEIGRLLGGRSSGAVRNALEKLAEDGKVVQASDKPVRYRLKTANGATAKRATK